MRQSPLDWRWQMTIGIVTGWRFSKGEAPPTNFFQQFNLRFPTIVKGGFYQKLAAYVYFGRPDLEILHWEATDRVPALQSDKI
jgi:S-adenosylmethionine synthetase